MSKVALVRCEGYDYPAVKAAVQKGIDLLGGALEFAKPNEKILLKPNWLAADPPEKCTTTHPMVFKAVVEVFINTGVKLSYGDSPGFQSPELAAKKTGFAAVAEELGLTLADFHTGKEIFFKEALQNKKFKIASGVLDSDGLISLPKLKTHGFLKLTGCIKNQFGCIPGALKAEFHVRIPNAIDFARMLIDLNGYLKPRLYIMDGIIAMEGNGPRGGNPKKMNILLFSADPIALDATVCRIINVNPELSPTIKVGKEVGLGTYLKDEINLLGDPLESFCDLKFDVNREPFKPYKPGGAIRFLQNALIPKPYINAGKCITCGICTKVCPVIPKAVDWHDGNQKNPPTYKYERCIRCYCCQELCPESAIALKVPFIRSIFSKNSHSEKISK
jgi:uncharacterized protein (DUF362 family)/Pyruvate/2-oxoacid:ferredoxin oxidoreductase delta subunit